jgi:intraflagellar transport protein 56
MMKGITKAKKPTAAKSKNAKGQPSLDHFISSRDYTGALALLEFRLKCQDGDTKELLMWIGYCSFHLGSFKRAEDAYKELLNAHDVGKEIYLFIAACYFFQQMYEEAEREALRGPDVPLRTRLLFNIAHRTSDENKLMEYHQQLKDQKEDQLSLAAVHYLRSHHQEVNTGEFDGRPRTLR